MPSVSKVILNGTTLMDVTDKTVDEDNLLYGETATKNDGTSVTGAVVTAPASATDPAMDGTATPGSADTYSRGDHVHPSDTNKQDKITVSGLLKGNGSGGVSAAVSGTDYQAAGNYMRVGLDYVTAGQKTNTTLGSGATAEGHQNTANSSDSHAEGLQTVSSAAASHAEGYKSTASGVYSHAEGNATTASGVHSHAEGGSTTASGANSHAEGFGTIANHAVQHVFGAYNVSDPSTASSSNNGNYIEIVGNGTGTSARSNARTLDFSGNEVLAGKLTVGVGPTNNMDVATKTYVDTSRQAKITASGMLKGDGQGGVSAAVAGTDYISSESDPTVPSWAKASSKPSYTATEVGAQPTITASGLLKGNGSGTISAAVAGTDYQAPITNPITGTGQNKYLAKFNGTNSITSGPALIAAGDGTYLSHDGMWSDPLPSRTGNSGKFLTTNGTTVSWANVSGVEYFTIISGVTEWTDFSATTFYNCYTSGKMPIVIDGDNGNIHYYPMNIASDSCIFEGITDIGDTGNVYCTYCVLFAYEDSSDNYIDTYSIGSGSSVSYTAELSSGTKVGTITIDGTDNDIYAPTNTDVSVTQTKAAYSSYTYWRPLTLGSSTNSTATGAFSTTTSSEYAFDNLRYQPSSGTLRTKAYNVAPTEAGTTASNNQMSSDSTNNIYFKVNNGADTVMTLYSNGTDMQVRPGSNYDNQVDLGKSTARWKDAYLSGTVNAADYAGDITATTTVASGDKIIVHDTSASNVAGGITLGTLPTQYLANDGSWQDMPVIDAMTTSEIDSAIGDDNGGGGEI